MAQLGELAKLAELGKLGKLAELGELLAELLTAAALVGRTDLLVLQGTPFCNVDCTYCYLPDRNNRRRMDHSTAYAAVRWVYESGLARPGLGIVWHAGEPLVLPVDWYRDAFAACTDAAPQGAGLRHAVQTNATLVDEAWCRLFLEHGVNVGVSLDGPAWLHDRYRRTRRGGGTHAAALRGVRALRRHAVPFHAICVVTAAALDAPDAIMDFFEEENVAEVGFNVDEREGARTCSSLTGPDIRERFAVFMTRALERAERPGAPMIREGRRLLTSLLDPRFNAATGNDENEPFRIVTVLWDGRLSTFSPELSGLSHPVLGEMVFGNVRADSLPAILASDRFRRAATEVATGVAACRAECAYFRLCRGGAPANKLAELGTFAGTETQHCRLSQQAVADVILTRLRATLSRCDSDSRKGSLYLTATRDT